MGVRWGEGFELALTPMFGGVAGDLDGVIPALRFKVTWWKLELTSESEVVVDLDDNGDSSFYNWSELGISPVDWLHTGVVIQRNRELQTPLDVQRGLFVAGTFRFATLTLYELNLFWTTPTWVLAMTLTFERKSRGRTLHHREGTEPTAEGPRPRCESISAPPRHWIAVNDVAAFGLRPNLNATIVAESAGALIRMRRPAIGARLPRARREFPGSRLGDVRVLRNESALRPGRPHLRFQGEKSHAWEDNRLCDGVAGPAPWGGRGVGQSTDGHHGIGQRHFGCSIKQWR